MEEREECDAVLSEIRLLIPFQVFLKLFRLSLKNFVKYKRLLLFSNVDIRFLYCLYFMCISFFLLISFDFINFANKLFLMENDFCKSKVIHDLDVNLSLFFVTFLRGTWLSKIALILLKKY